MTASPTKGLNPAATYIADNIGNVSGGVKRGAIHFRRSDLVGRCRSRQAGRLDRWPIYANAFVIYGRGLKPQLRHESR